jgi:hypothetical protein
MFRAFETRFNHGLSFTGVFAFVFSFFGSRLFATLNPTVTVQTGGIHLHHFWYGLAMVSAAGWLGITVRTERYDRLFAVVYGLGAGFIGDEVGLLLTLGDYKSELTYQFFIGAICFIFLATLTLRYGKELERDVSSLSRKERLFQAGVFVMGFSAFFFGFGSIQVGTLTLALGTATTILSYERRKKRDKSVSSEQPSNPSGES